MRQHFAVRFAGAIMESVAICDNKSVGVIIQDNHGRILLIKRARFPVGYAPPAGHIDDHGSPVQAAIAEVQEETGLRVALAALAALKVAIQDRRMHNQCRRHSGRYHDWWVYAASSFSGTLRPSPDEAASVGWYSREQLQLLADRTNAYLFGRLSSTEWEANPGLEMVGWPS